MKIVQFVLDIGKYLYTISCTPTRDRRIYQYILILPRSNPESQKQFSHLSSILYVAIERRITIDKLRIFKHLWKIDGYEKAQNAYKYTETYKMLKI